MGPRILILGPVSDDLGRALAALGGGAEIHRVSETADAAGAARAIAPDLTVIGDLGSLPSFLDPLGEDALARRAEHEVRRSVRYRHPVALAMLCPDGVGELEATYGAPVVDAFADALVEAARRALREVDLLFRPASREFAAILPETDLGGARIVVERLRSLSANVLVKPGRSGPAARPALPLKATASAGLACCPGEGIRSGADLLAAARAAMERARAGGGDRLATAP